MANTLQVTGTFLTNISNVEALRSAINLSALCTDWSPEGKENYEIGQQENNKSKGKLNKKI